MKLNQWKYGVLVAVALGLPGCYMGFYEDPHGEGYSTHNNASKNQTANAETADNNAAKPVQKTYATKEPTQKATPGPKQTAAPQLPVIQ